MTSDMPSSEIVSIVRFISFMTVIAIASDVGIATQTTIALRHERRKKIIAMPVSKIASSSVRTTICDLLLGEVRLHVDDLELNLRELPLELRQRAQARRSRNRLRLRATSFESARTARACR